MYVHVCYTYEWVWPLATHQVKFVGIVDEGKSVSEVSLGPGCCEDSLAPRSGLSFSLKRNSTKSKQKELTPSVRYI